MPQLLHPALLTLPEGAGGSLLVGLSAIFVVGMATQWTAWRLGLPSILLLLFVGLVAGQSGLIAPDALLGDLLFPFVSLSVAIILFEGGLTLEVEELSSIGPALMRLCSVGVLVTWVLATLAAWWLTPLPWTIALVLGALLTVTGPTVIGPLLRHVRPRGSVSAIAKWEGIVVDVIGATLAVLVLESVLIGSLAHSATAAMVGMLKALLVGGGIGALGGMLVILPLARRWIPDAQQAPLVLAVVLGVFSLCDLLQHESGLLGVTLMGVLLTNQKKVPVRHIIDFNENLRVLLISALFVLLSARLDLGSLVGLDLGSFLFVAALILVIRPVATFISLAGTELDMRQRAFLAWMAPRGIVAAAVSSLFALRFEAAGLTEGTLLVPITFLVIISTVSIYGLTASPVARALGLAEPDPQGVAIIGASPFARALGRALQEEEFTVLLVDTNRQQVSTARLEGLRTVFGSALSRRAEHALEAGGIGRLFALTGNDEVNALACLHHLELFGRGEVYQVLPASRAGREDTPKALRGRYLFGQGASLAELEARVRAGAKIKRTPITDSFDVDAWRASYAERGLALARITREQRLVPLPADEELKASPGEVILSLVEPGEGAESTSRRRTGKSETQARPRAES